MDLSAGPVVLTHGLSSPVACENLPGPGIKPVFPALAGRFLSTVSPGKSYENVF